MLSRTNGDNAGLGAPSWSAAIHRRKCHPFKHDDMNFLRSSPLSFLSLASLLQVFIFSCCAIALPGYSPFKHALMKWVFRPIVTGRFGNVTGRFGNVTGDSGGM